MGIWSSTSKGQSTPPVTNPEPATPPAAPLATHPPPPPPPPSSTDPAEAQSTETYLAPPHTGGKRRKSKRRKSKRRKSKRRKSKRIR